MKFYNDNKKYISYLNDIIINKLTCIYSTFYTITFYKNGIKHNDKNSAYINRLDELKIFYLNNKYYGSLKQFTKQSWRRFVKLKVFL
jgi:hypothetical protein